MTNVWYSEQLARWGLKVITLPLAEPITLSDARLHLRLDDDGDSPPAHPDDPLIVLLITAAREWCENYAGRSLAPQTLELGGTVFALPLWQACCVRFSVNGVVQIYGAYVELPRGPVSAVLSVRYIDDQGVEQTIATTDYILDDYVQPPRLYAAQGVTWPTPQAVPNAAKIRYIAGYDLPGDSPNPNPLPASILAAMKLVLGHLYENREQTTDLKLEQLPLGAQSLLDRYRLRLGMA